MRHPIWGLGIKVTSHIFNERAVLQTVPDWAIIRVPARDRGLIVRYRFIPKRCTFIIVNDRLFFNKASCLQLMLIAGRHYYSLKEGEPIILTFQRALRHLCLDPDALWVGYYLLEQQGVVPLPIKKVPFVWFQALSYALRWKADWLDFEGLGAFERRVVNRTVQVVVDSLDKA